MTNEELVKQIRAEQDTKQNMAELWQQNTGIVYQMARRFNEYAELDDLMQEGFLGLMEAVSHYDQSKEVSFIHYAVYWIRQKMMRYITGNDVIRVPEQTKGQIRAYNRSCQEFLQEHHRKPTEAEMSYITGLSIKDITAIRKAAKILNTGSLDIPIDEDESITLYDTVPAGEDGADEKDSVLAKVNNEQLAEILWGMVDELPEQQARVIQSYYRKNETLLKIAEAHDISLNRVSQLKDKALRTLRHPRRARVLKTFCTDDWLYSGGLSGNGVGSFNRSWTSSTERTALRSLEKNRN